MGLTAGLLLLLLLGLIVHYLRRWKKGPSQYEELLSSVPTIPACPAPMIPVSQNYLATLVPHEQIHDNFGSFFLLVKSKA